MKALTSLSAVVILATSLGVAPVQAEPGGCVKYGAAGAVGGHLMHHGVLGAVGGCAVGMYRRHAYRKQQRAAVQQQRNSNTGNGQGFGTQGSSNGGQAQPFAR